MEHDDLAHLRRMPRTAEVISSGVDRGDHTGAQVYVAMAGDGEISFGFGEARPGAPMTENTVMPWLSSSKPIGAVALAQLRDRGALSFQDRVAHHIPEFANGGKGEITIYHVLTHTGGFRRAMNGLEDRPWEELIAEICQGEIEPRWIVGSTAGYHPSSAWYIVGELVRRIDGRPFEAYVRAAIFEPLGMDNCWFALEPSGFRDYGKRMGALIDTFRSEVKVSGWDSEEGAVFCRPGASGRGPMKELSRFYKAMLNGGELEGRRIISSGSTRELVARHRSGLVDKTWGQVIDWGLGFMINSVQYDQATPYGYGPYASPATFGHSGAQSSSAFADPQRGLVAAYVFNGMPGEPRHQKRVREITKAIYEDLGLT